MATPRSMLGYHQPSMLGYNQPTREWTEEELAAAAIERAAAHRSATPIGQAWDRAWTSRSADGLRELALEAQQAGDSDRANALLRRADVESAKAGVQGNDVPSLRDIRPMEPGGFGRALNWAGGMIGQTAVSVAPAAGAALVGGAAGALMGGPAGALVGAGRGAATSLLRTIGRGAAATAVSYDQLRGEAVSNQFADPDVMKRSADERASMASWTAAAQAIPEAILPMRAAGAAFKAGGKELAKEAAQSRGKEVLKDMLSEGGTEGLQNEMGYRGLQALGSKVERDPWDYADAIAGGAAGGGTFSGAANLAGAALDKLIPAMRLGDFKGRPKETKAEDLANPNLTLEERVKGFFDERMTRKLARYLTPDAVLADELRGVSPEAMAEAIQKRDAEMAVESEADADSLLAQEGYLSESERQIVAGLKGKFNDPVNRAELGVIMGKRKIIEVAETLGQAAAGAAKRLLGKAGVKFSMEGMDVAPLVDALAPIYENKAPAAAQSWIKFAASLEGIKTFDALQDPDLAGRLEEMSEMLPLIDRKGSVRKAFEAVGLTNMFTLMDELQTVPGAVGDVRKPESFLRTMLKNRTDPQIQERAVAERVDQLASKFSSMPPEAQAATLDSFSTAFGTPENAKAVLEYYAPMRQQALDKFKAETDKISLPDQTDRGIGQPDRTDDQVLDNGLTEQGYAQEASYRDANPARPFYTPSDSEELDAEIAKAGTYEDGTPKVRAATMAEYVKRTGASAADAFGQIRKDLERRLNATRKRDKGWLTAQMERELPALEAKRQEFKTAREAFDAAEAAGKPKAELDALRAQLPSLQDRQTLEEQITKLKDQAAKAKDRSDLPRLEAEFAELQKLTPSQEDMNPARFDKALSRYKVALREGADTRATDEDVKRFQRLVRVQRNIKPPAPLSPNATREERDAHMARVIAYEDKVRAIDETKITFTKTDGSKLVTSAESMTYASPTKGGDLQKFLFSVASMLERDDIASVDLPSTLTVFRQGEKRQRRTLGEMRGVAKVREELMARAKKGTAKQKAFAQRALALIDASAEGAINRQVAGEARAKRRAEPTNQDEAADRDKIAAREAKREARRKKRDARDASKRDEFKKNNIREEAASSNLKELIPRLREAEVTLKKMRDAGDFSSAEAEMQRELVEDLRSEERVLSELVREWLDTELPLPKREEYTQNLADELVDEGYDETDLQAAYLDELITTLEQRLALVRPQMTKEQVRELYELNRELQLAVDREDAKASAGLTEAITYIVAEFDTQNDSKLVKSLKRDIEAAKGELNELMDSAGRNPRDGSRRVQENPTRYFQSAETIQELHQDLAQGVMGAELDRSQIPLIELAFQGEVDKLRAEMKDRKLSTPMHQEMIRAYQLALARLRRVKAEQEHATRVRARIAGLTKRFKDAKERPVRTHLAAQIRDLRKELAARAISHKDGVPLPLDPATSYGRVEPESKATPDPVGGGASRATKREGVEVLGLTPERNNERMANEIAFWKRNAEVKQLLAKKMKAPEDQTRKDPRTVGEIETHRKRTHAREEQVTKVIDTLIDTLKGMLAPKSEGTLVEAKPGLAEQRAQQQAEDLKGALERMAKLYGPAQEPVTAVTEVPAQGAKARSGHAIPKGFTGAREGRQSSNAKPITEAPGADDSNARLGTKELDREIAAGRARLKLAKSKRPKEERWPEGFQEKMEKRKAAALERAAIKKESTREEERQVEGQGRREEVLSKQNTQSSGTGPAVPTTTAALEAQLEKMRGNGVRVIVGDLLSGYGKYDRTVHKNLVKRLITVALHAPDQMSVLYHEALHDFFAELGKDPASLKMKQLLLDAANTGHIKRQLQKLLENEPAALAQLKDPEERLAYMFQFAMTVVDGKPLLRIGPNTQTIFGKIATAIRNMFGVVTSLDKAEQILIALHAGRLADTSPNNVAKVLAEFSTPGDVLAKWAAPVKTAAERMFTGTTDQLRNMNIPAISEVADLFYNNVKQTGLLEARAQMSGKMKDRVNAIVEGYSEKEIETAMTNLQAMKEPSSKLEKDLAKFFEKIYKWQVSKGVKRFVRAVPGDPTDPLSKPELVYEELPQVKRYFPRVWDIGMLTKHGPEFSRLLQKHLNYSQRQADDIIHQLRTGDGHTVKPRDTAGFSPYAQSVMARELILDESFAEEFAKFQSKDFSGVMNRYIDQAVHRAEYTERFGNMGEILNDMMDRAVSEGATEQQIERAKRIISGLDGTIHRDANPTVKQINMALLTLQNAILLPLAVFSQLIDPLGIAVRSGDLADAGAAYKRVLTDISQWVSGKKDHHREMAQIIGAVQQDSVMQAMGMVHNGMYMSRGLQKINNFIFKYNGMQGINNSFRTAAVAAAEKYILEHRNDARRMEELDLTPADIKETSPGVIDYSSEKVQQALFRFADGAVVRPNAAHRSLWMSDPRFLLVAHLKQFAFSFQEVILKRVAHEKSWGNSGPLKILAMYAPVMFAADMAKWTLFGGMPQNWSYLEMFMHAVHRSGLLGKFTFGADAVVDYREDRSALFGFLGPTAEHAALLASWIGGGAPLDEVIDRTVPLARLLTK